jgi:hypothetical protein
VLHCLQAANPWGMSAAGVAHHNKVAAAENKIVVPHLT